MVVNEIERVLTPRLLEARVNRVTLTGGEPTIHPHIRIIVRQLVSVGFSVAMCSNGTTLTVDDIEFYRDLGHVHFNISLDGFRPESHGHFRGDPNSFRLTVESIRLLGGASLLQGILVTPNSLAQVGEYRELCCYANEVGARYVLLNPLSRMGRGNQTFGRYRSENEAMQNIRRLTVAEATDSFETVYIRFPNASLPLAGCEAGTIIYIFTPGEVAICPYLIFAARTEQSQHDPSEFVVGNIFNDIDIIARLDAYRFHDRYKVGVNTTCSNCLLTGICGKGCPAAIVASGRRIGEVDAEVCPLTRVGTSHQ